MTRAISSAGSSVFPSHSVAASMANATTKLAKCSTPAGSVRRSATALKTEKYSY